MTAPALQTSGSGTVVGQLAGCAEDLAHLVGGCLIEAPDGRLVAHRLTGPDAPASVLTAVLAGDARALHAALVRPRTTCLLPSGPVVEGVLRDGGERVAHVLLRSGAGVWLLPDRPQPLDLEHAPAVLQRLEGLLACSVDEGQDLVPWLDGDGDVPAVWKDRTVRLARVEAPGVSTHLVARAIRCGTPLRHRGAVYVVVTDRVLPAPRVDGSTRIVVSGPTTDLLRARRQVDAALPAVPLGQCLTVEEARPHVVMARVAAALRDLPDLGPDPLEVLGDGPLLLTLRAWLDAGCDVVRTAELLGVHSNTLRYRLRRITELLGTDLRHDATARLELHLRLLATEH